MRYHDLTGKELIDADKGERLGVLGHTDLAINGETGQIEEIVIQDYAMLGFKKGEASTSIQWKDIEVIGEDMIVIKRD
ncbi:YlmC/YmxH family sporulation protein [Alkalibacillus salilacus]|uniref:YlmC/YmxH family sporulation protein n=1 Tax=Alkalibacillus salilacus TaxID=284582 RepID=A0ABT9VDL1_9BACI|nr:YlmC/YmxH family sporulation protein [Alkalibacillus salilacus]MDQ0159042.1 YlmC/YmxH family sporulation protein [Alkalibacillus salilacus]